MKRFSHYIAVCSSVAALHLLVGCEKRNPGFATEYHSSWLPHSGGDYLELFVTKDNGTRVLLSDRPCFKAGGWAYNSNVAIWVETTINKSSDGREREKFVFYLAGKDGSKLKATDWLSDLAVQRTGTRDIAWMENKTNSVRFAVYGKTNRFFSLEFAELETAAKTLSRTNQTRR